MRIAKAVRWLVGCVVGLALVALLGMGHGGPVAQADATVGNGQPGSCTEASLTTALAQGGHITFSCGAATVTIPITSHKLISKDTALDGTGLAITLDGNAAGQDTDGIFEVASGVTLNIKGINFINGQSAQPGAAIYGHTGITLTVSNSLFLNNISTVADSYGGGGAISLDSGSTAQITNSNFNYNKGPSGGAINSYESSLSISGSNFVGNTATGSDGGAIYSHSGNGGIPSGLTLESSQVLTNTAANKGGGISIYYAVSGVQSASLNNSVISGNGVAASNASGIGGGIFNGQAALKITNSLLNGNGTPAQGGGVWSGDGAIVNATNVTFTGNRAYSSGGQGGAIFRKSNSTLNLTNATITANVGGLQGGGLDTNTLCGGDPTTCSGVSGVTLNNSIIANNSSYSSTYYANCTDQVINAAYDLQWPALNNPSTLPCVKISNFANPDPTKLKVIDPKLANLANAGGSTPTLGLLEGSGALDSVPAASCPATDQRGVARPVGTACDIGAFEGTIRPPTLTKSFSPAVIGLGGTSTLIFTLSNPSTTGTTLSGVSFADSLPTSLVAASPTNLNSTCANASLSVTGGGSTLNLADISLTAGQSCTVSVDVTSQATTPGSVTNSVNLIAATATGLASINAQATLTITAQAPYSLTATAAGNFQINLAWQNSPANNTGFRIERSANDAAHFNLITTVGTNVTSYQDKNLSDGTTYYYRVAALIAGGISPYSNIVSVSLPLSPPSNLTAVLSGTNAISLMWVNTSQKQTGFHLEYRQGISGSWQTLADTPNTTYLDSSIVTGTLRFYRVRAYNSSLVSAYSNQVSLVIPGRWIVTEPSDSGDPNAAGTLSYALAQAAANSDKTISFQLTSGYTVTVQSGVTLPVAPGVTVGGSCGPNGPALVVAGGQWQLQGQATLFGLNLSGNGQVGPRIINKVGGQARGGNYLSCVVAKS